MNNAPQRTGILSEPISTIERFASHFTMGEDCWLWQGSLDYKGYGRFLVNKSPRRVHRIMWELVGNPVDLSKQLDHLCEVRNCVNPKHLEQVTSKDNTYRSTGPTSLNRLKTHCVNGHELKGENIYIDKRLYQRVCMPCKREHNRKYRLKRKAINEISITQNLETNQRCLG